MALPMLPMALPLLVPLLVPCVIAADGEPLARQTVYGGWATRDGLPAYVYTADQTAVPGAALPPNAQFGKPENFDRTTRGDREHSSMLGNDRIVLVGSNYGSWRMRQDEGGALALLAGAAGWRCRCWLLADAAAAGSAACSQALLLTPAGALGTAPLWLLIVASAAALIAGPKWLTDSDVDNTTGGWRFGGGLAYVYDAGTKRQLATTAFTPSQPAPREWGVGYGTTVSPLQDGRPGIISVAHTVAVLPGEEPAALIEVVLNNHDAKAREYTVAEVWDTGMVHQLTGHGWAGWSNWTASSSAGFSNDTAAGMLDRRGFVARHYSSNFSRFHNGSGVGAVQRRVFKGLSADEERFYAGTTILPQPPSLDAKASLWDKQPPAVFLAAIGGQCTTCREPTAENTAFANSAREFYGAKGPLAPEGGLSAGWHEHVPEGETG
jgi:hypothetical protein